MESKGVGGREGWEWRTTVNRYFFWGGEMFLDCADGYKTVPIQKTIELYILLLYFLAVMWDLSYPTRD